MIVLKAPYCHFIMWALLTLCCLPTQVAYAQNIQLKNYYEGKKALREIYYVKDTNTYVLDGEYIAYHANGKVKTRGSYRDNRSTGIWEYFFENGAIKMRGNLQPDGTTGQWEYYFENGQKSMEGVLIGGKRNDLWTFYYEQGGVKSKGLFSDGKRNGAWQYFNEDGTLKANASYKGDRGIYTEYYRSGATRAKGMNNEGKSDSLWVYFYENGHIKARGYYQNGLKNGPWEYFYENGKLSSKGTYKNGLSEGQWTYFHENGKISSEGMEKSGVKDGFWKLYHKSGVFKGESTFVQGDGPYKEYYEGGNLKISGYIKNEKNHGKWLYYYEDGKLEGESDFKDGVGQFRGYYKDGQLRMEGTIKDGVNVGVWKLYKRNGDLAGYYTTVYDDKGVVEYTPVEKEVVLSQEESGYYEIPEFLFKNKKLKYFQPRINEFKGIIIATNPVAMLVGSVPFSIEYYMQERLGYELLFNYIRDPFFTDDSNVEFGELYKRGFAVRFRQKFYQEDQKLGMLYFGHELSFSSLNHSANINDPGLPNGSFSIDAKENRYEYSVIVGNRMMKFAGKPGLTLDIFAGIGLGYRDYWEKFPPEDSFKEIFSDVRKPRLSIPVRLGINLGYTF
ncbi:MAG: membrane-binding protein [Cytophagales bacterium]|nr:membrane-binding protein [Cytophagales bacterium]